jgi:3',5'-cyclic AMP phosphodiesterase CpdA
MSIVAHLSDLHFGCHDPAAAESLLASLAESGAELVVVSGDLTQRARRAQFRAARAFLRCLPQPVLAVPGNHDIPLYDVLRRAFDPLGRYRRHVSPDPMPFYAGTGVCVLGLNSARAAAFAGGRISHAQMEAMERAFAKADARRLRVVALHHPLCPPPTASYLPAVGHADMAIAAMARANVRVVLAGHYHRVYTSLLAVAEPSPRADLLLIHAGTAISLRRRDEANSYNLLDLAPDRVRCITHMLDGARFVPARTSDFVWGEAGWSPQPPSPPG